MSVYAATMASLTQSVVNVESTGGGGGGGGSGSTTTIPTTTTAAREGGQTQHAMLTILSVALEHSSPTAIKSKVRETWTFRSKSGGRPEHSGALRLRLTTGFALRATAKTNGKEELRRCSGKEDEEKKKKKKKKKKKNGLGQALASCHFC